MIEQHGADDESVYQHLEAGGTELGQVVVQQFAEQEGADGEQDRRKEVIAVQELELWKPHQVLHQFPVGVLEAVTEYPSHMGIPESPLNRRVQIFFAVGILVVMPVMCSPPEWPLLCRGGTDKGQDKLKKPAGLESAV